MSMNMGMGMGMGMSTVWNARCKSGYEFERVVRTWKVGSVRIQKVGWKACARVCARGELVCADCHSAVVVREDKKDTVRMSKTLRALQTAYAMVNGTVQV